ncbi:MAG: hypothetical protein QGI33_01925 [Candidatus Brocadiia bacterium]|jgi:hypothetical protein|nr:hypothetical protein [Candidatus Brocadiia bacterium]
MEAPTILHVDIDAFFASAEQVLRPALRGRPVIVGSAQERRGVVASAFYEARAYGLKAGMPIVRARELCPHGVYLAGSFGEYLRSSREMLDVLGGLSPALERLGLDEAYVGLGGCERLYGGLGAGPLGRVPLAEALHAKRLIRARTGLNVSVGCAANKLAAKAASDFAKPNGVALVEPGRGRHAAPAPAAAQEREPRAHLLLRLQRPRLRRGDAVLPGRAGGCGPAARGAGRAHGVGGAALSERHHAGRVPLGFGVVQRGLSVELDRRMERDRDGFKLRIPALSR